MEYHVSGISRPYSIPAAGQGEKVFNEVYWNLFCIETRQIDRSSEDIESPTGECRWTLYGVPQMASFAVQDV